MKYYVYYLKSPKDGQIFYVGKGNGNRMKRHVQLTRNGKISNNNIYLYRKLKKILEEYADVDYEIVFESNFERESYEKEQLLINQIGLNNLCNLSLGYSIQSEYNKLKISNTLRDKYINDEDFINKMNSVFEIRKTREYRNSMSQSVKNSDKHKLIYTEEFRKNISESVKNWWSSLSEDELNEYKERMSSSLKNSKAHKEKLQTEEYKSKLSEGLKKSILFKEYNKSRKGKSRGKYKESDKNIKRRKQSVLVDVDGNIIMEFLSLSEVCEYFNIKTSTASVWLKNGKVIDNLTLKNKINSNEK